MFKLYNCSIGERLLDQSTNEEDIKETLNMYVGYLDTIDYKVKKTTCDGETTIARIKSIDDYVIYTTPSKVKTLRR